MMSSTAPGKLVLLLTVIALLAGVSLVVDRATDSTNADVHAKLAPGEWLLMRRIVNGGPGALQTQRAHDQQLLLRRDAQLAATRRGMGTWLFEGPLNIGGRVLDLAWDPTISNHVYVATATSGLWKSTDAGATFNVVWPDEYAQAIGAVAVDSNGVVYAGVGEGASSGNNPTLGIKGVFASYDGGQSWSHLGLGDSARIGRIRVDPTDNSRLYVAATGPVWAPGGERGVYRSIDAGANWQLVLEGENATTGAADVVVDPNNPNRVYAVLWDHIRQASFRRLGGTGSGIFSSDDGGDTWTRTGAGLPARNPDVGRLGLAMAPTDSQRLYAMYVDATGFFSDFFVSFNGGDNWTAVPSNQALADSQSSFGWWFGRVWVDPQSADRVYVAGVNLLVSANAGQSWQQAPQVGHVDQHAMAWNPQDVTQVFLGNDGGVFGSLAGFTDFWGTLGHQPITQFYTVAISQQDPGRIIGGTQDNRCVRNYPGADPQVWNSFGCGDGLEVLINPLDHNDVYACSQRGSCTRYANGGSSFRYSLGLWGSRRNWYTPLVFAPADPSTLYYGAERVYRSTNNGASFSSFSPDLTGGDPIPGDNFTFGTITTIAPSPSDPDYLYAGTDDGRVWWTSNGGNTWLQSTDSDLPGMLWVTKIAVDPSDALRAYVTYTGYHAGINTPYILATVDGGVSWTDITGNLPQAPLNSVWTRPDGTLLVASDLGVYLRYAGQTVWSMIGADLPNTPTLALQVHEPSNRVYAATFGRGIYSANLSALDSDGDGITDTADNCVYADNTSQTDTDDDGIGNACDGDFNNDCFINFLDLDLMRKAFFTTDALYDLTGDGFVNFTDLSVIRLLFFGVPGPAALPHDCIAM